MQVLWHDQRVALAVGYALAVGGITVGRLLHGAPRQALRLGLLQAVPLAVASLAPTFLLHVLARGRGVANWHAASALAGALASGAAGYLLARQSARGDRPDRLKRGTEIVAARRPRSWCPPWRRTHPLLLAGQAVDPGAESKHFKVIGTTGTGKTTAIRGLLAHALERGDSAVVADPDGVYAADYLDRRRGDVVLNPFDERSAPWDLFGECASAYDADQLARSLIADQAGDDRSWRSYARVLVAALIRRLLGARQADIALLYRLTVVAPTGELSELLNGTAAAPYLCAENSRFLASVRAIAGTHLAVLEHFDQPWRHAPVSVRRWIRERNEGGTGACLFLPYRAAQVATLRGAIAAWLRLAIFETMDLGAADHRIWFVADELDALGTIDGLKDALVRLRKFGGRCVLGFQSIAQVQALYGQFDAQTIVENCGNTLILRCSNGGAEGTAQFASRLIGEREVLRAQVSHARTRDFAPFAATHTRVLQQITEPAVLPAEIEQLADFAGFLKFASVRHWRRIAPADWR